ncbi:hypothetical protein [Roseovarius sp. SYSU LYC5161]|uniref:hypothetical protein n=1 Tax=Roseovarius halophilus (ex Wu et al. 2025) TaxID=3376060 RepID=UPI0028723002|nr:hypothetical protein [Roseovarius sp.]
MKNLITAAAVAASAAATPAVALVGISMNGSPAPTAAFDRPGGANELAMCGVYNGLFGNCARVAGDLGLSADEARALARDYWNTAPAERADFLADLGL